MAAKVKIIGAIPESLQGPGTITHEGGDPILIAEVKGGIASPVERALVYEGTEEIIDGDDHFTPADAEARREEIGEAVTIRALGQASYSFAKKQASAKKAPSKKEEAEVAA